MTQKNTLLAVSVIIPIYNKIQYLERCINSVLNSSLRDFEIICVDDASTDGSLEILEKIGKDKSNLKIYTNPQNMGVASTRNVGIEKASGKYIFFLDADDYIDSFALENYYLYMEEKKAHGCYIKLIDNYGNMNIRNSYPGIYSGKKLMGNFVDNNEMFLFACGSMWGTEFIRANDLRFRNLEIGEGGLFNLEALIKAERVVVSSYIGYHYCINESSTENKKESRQLAAVGKIYQIAYMLMQLQSDSKDKEIVKFLRWYLKNNAGDIKNIKSKYLNRFNMDKLSNISLISELIRGDYLFGRIKISEEGIKRIKEKGCLYLYGAGAKTLDAVMICNDLGVTIKGVFVSFAKGNPENIYGYKVNVFDEKNIEDKEVPFLIIAHENFHAEIENKLKECGIKNVIRTVCEE